MDKETLIRLATPASIALLAASIFSVPIMTKAGLDGRGSKSDPIYITSLANKPLYIACLYVDPYNDVRNTCR